MKSKPWCKFLKFEDFKSDYNIFGDSCSIIMDKYIPFEQKKENNTIVNK